jgi:hypothetical protein
VCYLGPWPIQLRHDDPIRILETFESIAAVTFLLMDSNLHHLSKPFRSRVESSELPPLLARPSLPMLRILTECLSSIVICQPARPQLLGNPFCFSKAMYWIGKFVLRLWEELL